MERVGLQDPVPGGFRLCGSHAESKVESIRHDVMEAKLEGRGGNGEGVISGIIFSNVRAEFPLVDVSKGFG